MADSDTEKKPKPIVRTESTDSENPRKVSFAGTARVSTGSKDEQDNIVPTKTANAKRGGTADTFSEISSTRSGDSGGIYEVIEYDPSQQVATSSMFSPGLDVMPEDGEEEYMGIEPSIGENTPAAEALRASAAVRVSRVGKAARAVNMQAVRKLVKRATGTSKHGVVKGKPPRLPPGQLNDWSEEESDDEDDSQINEAHVHQPKPQPSPQTIAKDHMPDDVVAGTAEAGKKVLGAVDPHDMLKVLRWRKKKKGGDEKKQKSYAKGKVIDGEHELYTLSIAVMIGVRTSISKTNLILNSGPSKRWVLPQDYRTTEKYEFRPKGGAGMPTHQLAHTFKFKDYAPVVFAYLRRMSGINEFDFLISVCGNANFIEFISNAKSGQFFFYSSDGQYMIKTMTNAESKFLRRILPDYFKHCCENPNTMITRFFGMYRVKLYHLRRNVKFVIMNSVYYTDKYLQTFYDLKGSVVGRDAKAGQAVKKDNDLRKILPQEALALPPETRARVRSQLEVDVKFMEEMGIMDYSMLVGVHHVPPTADQSLATMGYRTSIRKSRRRSTLPEFALFGAEESKRGSTPRQGSHSNLNANPDSTPGSASRRSVKDATPASRRSVATEDFGYFGFDDGLDDDDSSYVAGSEKRPKEITRVHEETEQKKLATIEKLYWPFHHLFDIHGHRRLQMAKDEADDEPFPESMQGYSVRKFEPPLSDRKDGGLEMDTTGLSLPLIYKGANGDQLYEGKIFYMGVIDILQEYNSRKMVEAQYRLFQASGKTEASCVDPMTYGQRFVKFFDEYTTRGEPKDDGQAGVEMTLSLYRSASGAPPSATPPPAAPATPEKRTSAASVASFLSDHDAPDTPTRVERDGAAEAEESSKPASTDTPADAAEPKDAETPTAEATAPEDADTPTADAAKSADASKPEDGEDPAKAKSDPDVKVIEPKKHARAAKKSTANKSKENALKVVEPPPKSPKKGSPRRRLFGGRGDKSPKKKE